MGYLKRIVMSSIFYKFAILVFSLNFMCISMNAKVLSTNEILISIGTYTDTSSKGIYLCAVDTINNTSKIINCLDAVNPSYIYFSKQYNMLYAVSETSDNFAGVSAYKYNKKSNTFAFLNKVNGLGSSPCHISVFENKLAVSEYGGGSYTMLSLTNKGELDKIIEHNTFKNLKPNYKSNVHSIQYNNNKIFIADLGLDMMLVKNKVDSTSIIFDEGFGPRHFCFNDNFIYVLGEKSGRIAVVKNFDNQYEIIQNITTDSTNVGRKGAADIHISKDKKYLYASNRLYNDGIAIFRIAKDGLLENVGYCKTGIHPRNFLISDNDEWLIVTCRDSNSVEFYKRNKSNGELIKCESLTITIPHPTCVNIIR